MEIKPHKKLIVWQKAIQVADETYRLTEQFPNEEKYGLAQQMRRAAISIASNIAEGAARTSSKEKLQFFTIARGSLSELDTQIEIVKRLTLGDKINFCKLNNDLEEVSRMLNGLIKNRRKYLYEFALSFIASSLIASSLFAGVGTTGAQFLKINPSARASGMAGAYSGISDDLFALYSNPAGLAQLENSELATTFLRYFADINFGFIGYSSNVRDFGVMGFGYTYLMVDKIEKRDASENRLDDFNAKDTSLTIAYGRKDAAPSVLENLSLGASLKLIGSEIDQVNAYAVALDLGAMYSPVEKLNVSFAIQNIGNGISFRDATDKLPLNFKLGAAYAASEKLKLCTEIDEYVFDNKFYAAAGTEYWAARQFALRLGYRFGYDTSNLGSNAGLSAGMGFRIWSLGLDYAFVPFGDLGDTHRITFMAKF